MGTPTEIEKHEDKYKKEAWRAYDLSELGMWAHLFVKRSAHRTDFDKKIKDLTDAKNYLAMAVAIVEEEINTAMDQEKLKRHEEGALES